MLIGLSGGMGVGKDQTWEVIHDLYPFSEKISFADDLKDSLCATLGLSRELLEELKRHDNIHISMNGMSLDSLLPSRLAGEASKWQATVRELIQRYGTEGHRDIFGNDFWIDKSLPLSLDHSERLIIVTDMRFPNEVERVKDLGGTCVRIVRNSYNPNPHSSEQDLSDLMDYDIDNNGTVKDLYKNVANLMTKLNKQSAARSLA